MSPKPAFRLDDFIPYLLSVAANAVSDAVAATYRTSHDLGTPEWRLIAVLAEDGALTPQAIGRRTRMDKVTVSRAAVVLLERGFVRRSPNPLDQRSHMLSLTAAGQAVYQEVAPQALQVQARILEGFTPQEIEMLSRLLTRAEAAASSGSR
ncbi:MarR family transcriptional regulator [Brevundimonas naejangsanensis]|uniref:MarR family transcriptional regulator n=1 Tax=Brevundimonas naejangsanensis TaxID=588932 RepID=A0A494RM10_9CAUL|nr:MarR family winged helix-turn-helix transcriptional regulator [Brevundimonas naejangsanensis]AYG95750.1 MarR family transcriptional regulator [Brevundimonas naejangsanensis]